MWEYIGSIVMIGIGLTLIYLAVAKEYEPLLLLPIGFGAILTNIPYAQLGEAGGMLHTIKVYGVENELLPALLFISIGAMSDFTSLIRKPMLLAFAAAGQLGIFAALNLALFLGFSPLEASSVGIIGAMDGPTAIFI
ncbi:MAG: sodium ion-translocating decarboxylase subunit beta, partial [Candidatus Bathyarchaeota archaeon]